MSAAGDDVRAIAGLVGQSGLVVGIDPSNAMIAESKRRANDCDLPVEFTISDARKLEFADASFDRVRTDRVLMFVPEVQEAIAEIVRVLRPTGRVVASEIDHETHFLDSRCPEVTRKVLRLFAESAPQPCLGKQLARLFSEAGLQKVKSVPRVVLAHYNFFCRVYHGFLTSAIARGCLTEADITFWLRDLAACEADGAFNYGLVVFTVSGEKPVDAADPLGQAHRSSSKGELNEKDD
jgi:SAM-dependent methyltransferase